MFKIDQKILETSHPVLSLEVSDLRLVDDIRWPWVLLIPRVSNVVELIDLAPDLRDQVWLEVDQVARVIKARFSPSKLNIAAIGNQVRQLHIHLIARFIDDSAWPNTVWGVPGAEPYKADELMSRVRDLKSSF